MKDQYSFIYFIVVDQIQESFKLKHLIIHLLSGVKKSARNRNRTCTSLRIPDFESGASTNSAIRAGDQIIGMQM